VWVVNSWVVLGEPGGGDEVVDLAVLRDDLVEGRSHGLGLGDIGVVSGDTRNVFRARILALELCDKSCGLLLTLVLWKILRGTTLKKCTSLYNRVICRNGTLPLHREGSLKKIGALYKDASHHCVAKERFINFQVQLSLSLSLSFSSLLFSFFFPHFAFLSFFFLQQIEIESKDRDKGPDRG
jgi:hypothetical protein